MVRILWPIVVYCSPVSAAVNDSDSRVNSSSLSDQLLIGHLKEDCCNESGTFCNLIEPNILYVKLGLFRFFNSSFCNLVIHDWAYNTKIKIFNSWLTNNVFIVC